MGTQHLLQDETFAQLDKTTIMNDSNNKNFSKLQKKSVSNSYQNQKSLKIFNKREFYIYNKNDLTC